MQTKWIGLHVFCSSAIISLWLIVATAGTAATPERTAVFMILGVMASAGAMLMRFPKTSQELPQI